MTDFSTIKLELTDGYGILRLNRPDRMNSFTVQMHEEVQSALATVEENCRALLITGNGRGFCAGQDLSDRAVSPGGEATDLGVTVETYWNPLVRRVANLPFPVVCAVNGVAAGAGANLALACDIVLAARGSKFIQSFANIGLIPDTGGTWALPRLVGQARAMAIALTATPVSAEQAEAWGMIWRAVDDDALLDEATQMAAHFAKAPTKGLAATKKRIREAWANDFNAELDAERDAMRELGFSADYQEGVAAFLEKRTPNFTGK